MASLLVIVVAAIIAAGCMGGTSTPGAHTALPGTSWTLASLAGENGSLTPIINGTAVTATFSLDRNVGGSAGCNHYSAPYTVDGESLAIEPAIRTEMYCNEPPGLMDQEDRYLAHLTEVASYRIENDRLILADSEGNDLLVFEKAARTPDLPLVGTKWVLDSYSTGGDAISSVIAGTTVTVTFGPDGSVGGNAGCNHYGGEYTLDGAKLSTSSLFSTLMYCETPGVMEQEATFMAHLANATSYRVDGDRLTLTDAEGNELLFFTQAKEVPPAPLTGTAWTLESYSLDGEAVSSVIAGTTVTAVFSADGNVGGNAGCNSYGAGYRLDGMNLTIEPPISTKIYCNEPEGLMKQESTYLGLLEGNRLTLTNAEGTDLLVFVQAPSVEGRWASPPASGQYDLLDENGNIVASY